MGEQVVDVVSPEADFITYSTWELFDECTPLFVPAARVQAARTAPLDLDWLTFRERHDGVIAGMNFVEVSTQGESERLITLTGVEFEAEDSPRPDGAVFGAPCGDELTGRHLLYDLDTDPPVLVASSTERDAAVGAVDAEGNSVFEPMTFPWTVSLTDPLLLMVGAQTNYESYRWRAYITWRSGDKSGRISIDNGGDGYGVVGVDGVDIYGPDFQTAQWQRG